MFGSKSWRILIIRVNTLTHRPLEVSLSHDFTPSSQTARARRTIEKGSRHVCVSNTAPKNVGISNIDSNLPRLDGVGRLISVDS
jgi:hypothetical protein